MSDTPHARLKAGCVAPRRPNKLSPGDTLGVVSPSSPSTRDSDLERFRRWAHEHEFEIKVFAHASDRYGYLAGSDEARGHDVSAAFADGGVDAVVTMRGGFGGWRTVPHVDFEVVRANPKLFIGYSDTTALHLAIGRQADLVTFYGPSASSLIGRGASQYTLRHFLRAARDAAPLGVIEKDPDDPFTWSVTPGVAEGPLRGGCLSLLAQSLGTPWEVDWDGCIVFVEDVNEEPYRIDGMLTHLKLAGTLDNVAGFVVGEHVDCGPRQFRPSYPYGTFSTEDVYRQHLEPLGVPVMVGLPCGHGKHLATLPLGALARLDADRLTLEVLEPATA
ncbi:MAG TPA: LD-carboxypeptidase [Thermomicrobiales bacterium]|nr:LD-carboxypeptidase [Thermomicrobiales bacterium]